MVHTCCAPCGTYVFKRLREDQHSFKVHFYNPNIHPAEEYQRRQAAMEQYAAQIGLDVTYDRYEPQEYWTAIGHTCSTPDRCNLCYRLRLMQTAKLAKAEGYDAFTTTLLISPYQDQEAIKSIAEQVARATGVDFHYEDYRQGYRESRNMAREANLYRQKYCGCHFSISER